MHEIDFVANSKQSASMPVARREQLSSYPSVVSNSPGAIKDRLTDWALPVRRVLARCLQTFREAGFRKSVVAYGAVFRSLAVKTLLFSGK